jgi:uncharacterized protein (TIGR02266 family)
LVTIHEKESEDNQRITKRSDMLLKVEYSSTSKFFDDYTENISDGGVFIATTLPFETGQLVDFSISFPGLLDPIQLRGEVRWQRPQQEDLPSGIGIRFLIEQSPHQDSLRRLLTRIQSKEPRPTPRRPMTFRVLLVEENIVIRDMFRYSIQKLTKRLSQPATRLDVVEADNNKDAWETLRTRTVHLVIVDLYTPVSEGIQLIEEIRKHDRLKNMPILVVSSGGREGRRQAIKTGADVFLDKPIKLKQMMETIETLLVIGSPGHPA